MQTLKINIPKGFVIDKFDETTGEVSLKPTPKVVTERIKTFDDVLKENGTTREEFEKSCKGLEPDEIAYKMAKLVCLAYNEGWIPDWNNSNEYKYYPYFKMGSSSGVSFSYFDYDFRYAVSGVGAHLCFKSSNLAKHAGKLFEQEIYKPLLTIFGVIYVVLV